MTLDTAQCRALRQAVGQAPGARIRWADESLPDLPANTEVHAH